MQNLNLIDFLEQIITDKDAVYQKISQKTLIVQDEISLSLFISQLKTHLQLEDYTELFNQNINSIDKINQTKSFLPNNKIYYINSFLIEKKQLEKKKTFPKNLIIFSDNKLKIKTTKDFLNINCKQTKENLQKNISTILNFLKIKFSIQKTKFILKEITVNKWQNFDIIINYLKLAQVIPIDSFRDINFSFIQEKEPNLFPLINHIINKDKYSFFRLWNKVKSKYNLFFWNSFFFNSIWKIAVVNNHKKKINEDFLVLFDNLYKTDLKVKIGKSINLIEPIFYIFFNY